MMCPVCKSQMQYDYSLASRQFRCQYCGYSSTPCASPEQMDCFLKTGFLGVEITRGN